jgi:hypothetical protein
MSLSGERRSPTIRRFVQQSTLDHAVGLKRLRRGQAMLDVEGGAQRVELVRADRGALAQAEEAIRELLAILRKNCADTVKEIPVRIPLTRTIRPRPESQIGLF